MATSPQQDEPVADIFPDTEMGHVARAFDWTTTPLGPVDGWSPSLKAIVAMVLRQGLPQSLCWGPDLRQIYNDAYRVIMGDKHPRGFAQPVLENWAESAAAVGELLASVVAGKTVYFEDLPVPVTRREVTENAFFTFSYSPVLTEAGAIGGLLINCFETTDQVVGRRAQAERDVLAEALKLEKARLEAVFQQSPSFLAILRGADNVFEAINPAYEQVVGHGRNVIGKPLLDALPETRGQGFDRYLGRVRETGVPLVFRDLPALLERVPGAAPEQRYIDVTYLPLIEADGTHEAVIAHGADVTDHVLARRELELSNQQLQDNAMEMEAQAEELQATAAHLEERTQEAEDARRTASAIVEAVTDGFIAFDADVRFTYVNRRAAEMWGMPAEVLLGKVPSDLWPSMSASPFLAMIERVRASGEAGTADGYSSSLGIPIAMRAYPSSGGGIVAFFTDMTERQRAEAAALFLAEASRLLASAEDYTATLNSLAKAAVPALGDWCAVDVLTDPESGLWPPKIERVAVVHRDPSRVDLARSLTEEFPQDWSRSTGTPGVIRSQTPMFVPEVTDDMLVAGAQNARHLERLRALNFRSIIVVPLVARGRALGAMTLVMAESERRFTTRDVDLAQDLGQRAGIAIDNARLLRNTAEANAAKTDFLRTISHELRQPLNAIRGYVDLWTLGLRGEISSTMREDIDRVVRNQDHLSTLIEDLLSFTRLEAGQLTVERVPVSVTAVITTLEAMISPQMSERGLQFALEPCDPGVTALGDKDRIVQVCLNLLTNAMRATPSGGRVSVECRADSDTVTIAVVDTGVGIPDDKLETIFAPFMQLGRSLNAPKEGAGLGLAISRGLAEAMGGQLSATSVEGAGSTFTFRLPRS